MPPSLSELKVLPSFCLAFKIPDDLAVTYKYISNIILISRTIIGMYKNVDKEF